MERILPRESQEELEHALEVAQNYLLSLGVTTWQDAWVTERLHLGYLHLAAEGGSAPRSAERCGGIPLRVSTNWTTSRSCEARRLADTGQAR